jgi:hypothetical protein
LQLTLLQCSCTHSSGVEELQLAMEVAELEAATIGSPRVFWRFLESLLRPCPYPALLEFTTRHGRTLLTLAERSLEAGMEAAAELADIGSSSSGRRHRSRASREAADMKEQSLEAAAGLASCLVHCLNAFDQGAVAADAPDSLEAADENPCRSAAHACLLSQVQAST